MKKILFILSLLSVLLFTGCPKETGPLYPVSCAETNNGVVFSVENISTDIFRIHFFKNDVFLGNIIFNSDTKRPDIVSYTDYFVTPGKDYSYTVRIYDYDWNVIEDSHFNVAPANGHGEMDLIAPDVSFSGTYGTIKETTEWNNRWMPADFTYYDFFESYKSNGQWAAEKSVSEGTTSFYFNNANTEYITWSVLLQKKNTTYNYNTNIFSPTVRITTPTAVSTFDYEAINSCSGFGFNYSLNYGVSTIRIWASKDNYPDFWKAYIRLPEDISAKLESLYKQWCNTGNKSLKKEILDTIKLIEN